MKSTFAIVQMECVPEPENNLAKAGKLLEEAVSRFHPDFVVFPETCSSEMPAGSGKDGRKYAEPLDGPFTTGMKKLAKQYGVWMVFGMKEQTEDPQDERIYNTCVMLDGQGDVVQFYRKTHLYDAFGYKESDEFKAGSRFFEPVDTPFGKVGLFVCYEVRFPEVARYERAKGAQILLMPTAWVKGDLKSIHFHTLIRARAIENAVYLLAADQYGKIRMGESVAVDPMGVTLASAGEGEQVFPVYIDTDRIRQVEQKMPAFRDRRSEMYRMEG